MKKKKELNGIIAYWKLLLNKHKLKNKNRGKEIIDSSVITNIIVFPGHKLLYIKYPKNGGSTILRHIIDKTDIKKYHYGDHPIQFETWLNHMTDKLLHEYFIFTISRNPYQRLESALQSRYPHNKDFSELFSIIKTEYNQHWVPQYVICDNKNIFDYVGKMEENYDESVYFLLNKLKINVSSIPHTNKSEKIIWNYDKRMIDKINDMYINDFQLFKYKL